MWLNARREQSLTPIDSSEHVIRWRVDINVLADGEDSAGRDTFTVGRILADELRPYEIAERGESVLNVADEDSSGLEGAWASLFDEEGEFRTDELQGSADSVLYMYRFQLHADFVD